MPCACRCRSLDRERAAAGSRGRRAGNSAILGGQDGTFTEWGALDANDIVWVLWSATVGRESAIAARVEAAHTAGFTQLSVSPEDVGRAAGEGMPAAVLGRRLRGEGLEIVLDPVMNWYGDALDDVFRMAEDLGAVAIAAIGPFTPDEVPPEQLPARFATFCDRAADSVHGCSSSSCPSPRSRTWPAPGRSSREPTGATAVSSSTPGTSSGATRTSNCWLACRGPHFGVQVSDAPVEVQGTLGEDTFHRLLPGDGSFDLERVLRVLDEIGGLRWVGPEVLSPASTAHVCAQGASCRLVVAERSRLAGRARRRLGCRHRWPDSCGCGRQPGRAAGERRGLTGWAETCDGCALRWRSGFRCLVGRDCRTAVGACGGRLASDGGEHFGGEELSMDRAVSVKGRPPRPIWARNVRVRAARAPRASCR